MLQKSYLSNQFRPASTVMQMLALLCSFKHRFQVNTEYLPFAQVGARSQHPLMISDDQPVMIRLT